MGKPGLKEAKREIRKLGTLKKLGPPIKPLWVTPVKPWWAQNPAHREKNGKEGLTPLKMGKEGNLNVPKN